MAETTYMYLIQKGIKPSQQRIAVMDYLLTHSNHPTADTIFNELQPKMPTLSRTTIYNTLKLFADQEAILSLDIEGKNCHYDGDIKPHAHFICKKCEVIYDLPIGKLEYDNRDNFMITETNLYLKGFCNKCIERD